MSTGTIRRLAGTAALIGLLAGCGSAASQAPASASAAAVGPSVAPTIAPSVAPPSEAAGSVGPSIALPSFVLPSEAKDLEALLPDTMCGATATKTSQSGQSFTAGGDEDFAKVLAALGKSPSDVAYAIAFGADSGCAAGIFRIQGVDTGTLQAAFQAQAQANGDTFTDKNLGGKDVKVQTTGSSTSYFYFKGDAVIFATAKTDADAATVLQQLP
jgi:hypothetical protein